MHGVHLGSEVLGHRLLLALHLPQELLVPSLLVLLLRASQARVVSVRRHPDRRLAGGTTRVGTHAPAGSSPVAPPAQLRGQGRAKTVSGRRRTAAGHVATTTIVDAYRQLRSGLGGVAAGAGGAGSRTRAVRQASVYHRLDSFLH